MQICYIILEGVFIVSRSNNNKADGIDMFNNTSRCLDDLLNIDSHDFK